MIKSFFWWSLVLFLLVSAYYQWAWQGVLLALGGIVFWLLLQWSQVMLVMGRAAKRPMGYVDSAVMLSSRLRKNMTLIQVVGMASSLGEKLSTASSSEEVYRWTDNGQSRVTCSFVNGRLQEHNLWRPSQE